MCSAITPLGRSALSFIVFFSSCCLNVRDLRGCCFCPSMAAPVDMATDASVGRCSSEPAPDCRTWLGLGPPAVPSDPRRPGVIADVFAWLAGVTDMAFLLLCVAYTLREELSYSIPDALFFGIRLILYTNTHTASALFTTNDNTTSNFFNF